MKFSPSQFHCTSYKKKDDCHILCGKLSGTSCCCPACQMESFTVHSFYTKTIQDLPISRKSVFLVVRARRFTCKNKEWLMNYFTQTTEFTSTGAPKTTRLENLIIDIVTPTSLLQATDILRNIGIITSKSAVAKLLKKVLFSIDSSIFIACLDDLHYENDNLTVLF